MIVKGTLSCCGRGILRAINLSPLAVAKRIGSHGENALADVNRKTLLMRIAKLFFRLRKLFWGGCLPPLSLSYEITTDQQTWVKRSIPLPRLGL